MSLKYVQNKYIKNSILFCSYFIIPFMIYIFPVMNGNLIVSGDGEMFLSFKQFLAIEDALATGGGYGWCPYLQNGVPFLADQSFGSLYPISFLIGWLPTEYFLLTFYSIHIAVAGFFTNRYLKELECDSLISFVFGIIFSTAICLGGFRKNHIAIISTVIWIPAILYFIQRYINTKEFKYLLFASIVMATQFLAGFMQIALYTDIILGLYLLLHMIDEKMKFSDILKKLSIWVFSYISLIAFQLLPMFSILFYYSSAGSLDTPYETFITYSISFRKLLMMVYPKIFGADVFMPYGINFSSEMDVELFLGMALVVIGLVAAITLFKKATIKIICLLSVLCFIYAANAHIPYVSQILYRIPILGSFRVPSRIIFIFIFFCIVLSALGVSHLRTCKDKMKFLKASFMTFIVFIIIACLSVIIISGGLFTPQLIDFYNTTDIFIQPILLAGISIALMMLYVFRNNEKTFYLFLASVVVGTLFQTMPYYKMYSSVPAANYMVGSVGKQLKEAVGEGTLWYPSQTQKAYFESIIGFNKQLSLQVSALNCYISMNNPNLYRIMNNNEYAYLNYSGLYTWSPMGEVNVVANNNILSMLGVNVIADTENIISSDGRSYYMTGEAEQVLLKENIEIPDTDGELFVASENSLLEDNTFYKINFTAESNGKEDSLYVDFFGEGYDSFAQNYRFHLEQGKQVYTGYIFTGKVPENIEPSVRIIATPNYDINIEKFELIKMETFYDMGVYTKIFEENGYTYYRNNNAHERMYFVNAVENLKSVNKFYENVQSYDFDTTSYVEGVENKQNLAIGKIESLSKTNSSFTANVTLEEEGFLNLIQNYFPGWKVYIDGNETQLYTVNGSLQGAFVPKGIHEVKFIYTPQHFVIGSCFSLSYFLFLVVYLIYIQKRKRNISA